MTLADCIRNIERAQIALEQAAYLLEQEGEQNIADKLDNISIKLDWVIDALCEE